MGSRRFLSWPAGWQRSMPLGIVVGIISGALLIVAQGLGSGWNQIDWCGSGGRDGARIAALALCLVGAALLYFGTLVATGLRVAQFVRRG